MRAADRLEAGFGQAVMKHLALSNQILQGSGHVLDGHLRIDAMLVEQVNAVGSQAPQLGLDHLPDVFGPAVSSTASLTRLLIDVEAELGGHYDPMANALKGLADDFLRKEGAIGLGGIEQRDAETHRAPDEGDGHASVGAASVQVVHRLRAAAGMPLTAQPDREDLSGPRRRRVADRAPGAGPRAAA